MNYAENFARNLKAARKQRQLTQKAFAELLGFSEKTFSKWECGVSIPDIGTLFSIARVLGITMEQLFRNEETYLLGIDGGGTKTMLILADTEGKPLRTLKTDGCNPVSKGLFNAQDVLRNAIAEICHGIPMGSIYLFAGIAGGTSAGMQEKLEAFFSGFGFADFRTNSDNLNIIAAELGTEDGISVIMGTGVCVYTQKQGKHRRYSGWGALMDNGGSGYNLGRDALSAHFSALDGTGEATLLTEEIAKIFPGTTDELMQHIYSGGRQTIAAFAPAVFSALEQNDAIAEGILRRNMAEVARLVRAATKEFSSHSIPVVLAGGLVKQEATISFLRNQLQDDRFRFRTLQTEPICGAVKLAKQLMEEKRRV